MAPARKTMCGSAGDRAQNGRRGLRLAEANVTLCRELALASLDGEGDVFSLVEVLLQY